MNGMRGRSRARRLVSGRGYRGVADPWLLRQVAFNALGILYRSWETELLAGADGAAGAIEERRFRVAAWAIARWGEGWHDR